MDQTVNMIHALTCQVGRCWPHQGIELHHACATTVQPFKTKLNVVKIKKDVLMRHTDIKTSLIPRTLFCICIYVSPE